MDDVNNNEETDVNGQDASTSTSQDTDTSYTPAENADQTPQTGPNPSATALANFAICTYAIADPIHFRYTPASDLVLNNSTPYSADDLSFERWVTGLLECGLISAFAYNIMYRPDAESMTPIRNAGHFRDAINDALGNSKPFAMFQILPVTNGA